MLFALRLPGDRGRGGVDRSLREGGGGEGQGWGSGGMCGLGEGESKEVWWVELLYGPPHFLLCLTNKDKTLLSSSPVIYDVPTWRDRHPAAATPALTWPDAPPPVRRGKKNKTCMNWKKEKKPISSLSFPRRRSPQNIKIFEVLYRQKITK